MLPTFVIGLREGLEAALIVGIIAAFLKRNGQPAALRQMWIGVGLAIALCLAVGVTLRLVSEGLPQQQQEMLECVIAAVAVIMISYMILWMNKHSRGLKKELESAAGDALANGSATALVLMAFLAVLREGFETSVFLLAAFQNAISPAQSVAGVALGIAVAIVLGYLIYRGGTKLNLSRFFRITGVVLVLVAGGLVISTLRAAFEAGWLTAGQQTALDLRDIIAPGTVESSLAGGILGIQPQLAVVEVTGWVLFVIPMLAVVLWPRKKRLGAASAGRLLAAVGVLAVVAAVLMMVLAPANTDRTSGPQGPLPVSGTAKAEGDLGTGAVVEGGPVSGTVTVTVLDGSDPATAITTTIELATDGSAGVPGAGIAVNVTSELQAAGHAEVGGVSVTDYQGKSVSVPVDPVAAGLPATVTGDQLKALNNNRYPIGLTSVDATEQLPAVYTDTVYPTLHLDQGSGLLIGADFRLVRTLQVTPTRGFSISAGSIAELNLRVDQATNTDRAALITAADRANIDHETWGRVIPIEIGVFALIALVAAALLMRAGSRTPADPVKELQTVS